MNRKSVKLFEYDKENKIVDIHIRKDPDCPYPFHLEDWYHQGFYLTEFIIYLKDFFQRNDLSYKISDKNE